MLPCRPTMSQADPAPSPCQYAEWDLGWDAALTLWRKRGAQAYNSTEGTMRFGSTAKVLLKCKLKYYRISECEGNMPSFSTHAKCAGVSNARLGGAWCAEKHAGPHLFPSSLCKLACTRLAYASPLEGQSPWDFASVTPGKARIIGFSLFDFTSPTIPSTWRDPMPQGPSATPSVHPCPTSSATWAHQLVA